MTAATLPLRPFVDADYEAFVDLNNRLRPDKARTVEDLRHFESKHDEENYRGRFLLERSGALIAAVSFARDMNQLSKQVVVLDILLEPAHFELAEGLYEHLLTATAPHKPEAYRVSVREDQDDWQNFYEVRGFVEYERRWISALDVEAFDPTPFAWSLAGAAAAGIGFKTLADLPDTEATQRALYGAVTEILRDVPFEDPLEVWPFERWRERWWGNPGLNKASYFLAFDGDELVGVSELYKAEQPDKLNTGLTGVRRNWRRQGVAQALKIKAVLYAKERGVKTISTTNHSVNRPMLAINEAMGFEKAPVWLYLKKGKGAP